jgi:outer membrane lipoprotein SlyB
MSANRIIGGIFVSLSGIALTATSSAALEPQFYPNGKYNSVTVAQLQKDVQSCKSQATQATSGSQPSVVGTGVRTAAKGAALGALAGAITGDAGRGAGAGAAVGGVVGTAKGVKGQGSGNPDFQKYTSICLEERGYKVVGWK